MLTSKIVDFFVRKSFELKMPKFGEGIVYWFKGVHRHNLVEKKTRDGVRLWLNPHNYIDRILLGGKEHDAHVIDAIKTLLRDGDIFWDVGANIGFIGLSVLRMMPSSSVVAFEPSPFSLVQLFLNNQENGGKMHIVPFALSSSDGIQEFSMKINRNSGQSTLLPSPQFNYDCSLKVQTKIADDLVAKGLIPSPHIIKIDVEGAEFMVLSGMEKVLASSKLRAILFESPSKIPENISGILSFHGFNTIVRLNNFAQTDFLATRK